jgi:hypothetical protein
MAGQSRLGRETTEVHRKLAQALDIPYQSPIRRASDFGLRGRATTRTESNAEPATPQNNYEGTSEMASTCFVLDIEDNEVSNAENNEERGQAQNKEAKFTEHQLKEAIDNALNKYGTRPKPASCSTPIVSSY